MISTFGFRATWRYGVLERLGGAEEERAVDLVDLDLLRHGAPPDAVRVRSVRIVGVVELDRAPISRSSPPPSAA